MIEGLGPLACEAAKAVPHMPPGLPPVEIIGTMHRLMFLHTGTTSAAWDRCVALSWFVLVEVPRFASINRGWIQ